MKKSTSAPLCFVLPGLLLIAACGGPQPTTSDASGTITALQVPSAEGSIGPNLIKGQDGTIVLSWMEPDGEGKSLRHSTYTDGAWSDPRTVISGDNWFANWADFPSVVPVSDTLWAAHWLVSREAGGYAYDVHTAVSSDGGDSWSDSKSPHSDGTDTEHGFVTLFADAGAVGMIWLDGRQMVNEYDENDVGASGMTLRFANVDKDMSVSNDALVDNLVCDCCQTDVALTAEGPVAVYRDRTVDEVRDIYVSRRVDGEWQPGYAVSADNWEIAACPVNGPIIQADGQHVAVVWFTGVNEEPRVKAAWSDDAGRTFSDPIEIDANHPVGRVGAALLPNGDIAVSWLRSTGLGGSELRLRRVTRNGDLGEDYLLEEAKDVFSFSVPQITRDGDNLIVAWTNEVEGVYSVASAVVPAAMLK